MTNETAKLNAALASAKEYLLAGDPPAAALADAAEEHGFLPALLTRRFEAAYGAPETYAARVAAAAADVAAAAAANAAAARRKAAEVQQVVNSNVAEFNRAEAARRAALRSGRMTRAEYDAAYSAERYAVQMQNYLTKVRS